MAAGFLLYVCGHKLYFAGETGLGADIKFIGDYYKPNIAVLPTGGTTSLHPADIHRVVFWLGADIVIPTWAAKETPDNLDEIVTVIDHETSAICKQIPVGESWQLQSARPMERRSGPESGY
jgi:L-ascorbate metabolism protein UlaG (beta-lactamase superfamily)